MGDMKLGEIDEGTVPIFTTSDHAVKGLPGAAIDSLSRRRCIIIIIRIHRNPLGGFAASLLGHQ